MATVMATAYGYGNEKHRHKHEKYDSLKKLFSRFLKRL